MDDCRTCTLEAYIRMVCDGDLNALVLEGEPPMESLEEAGARIVSELAMLSGSADRTTNVTRKVYFYHSLLLAYAICADLVASGEFEEAVGVLNSKGVRCSVPKSEEEREKLLRRIRSAMTEKTVRLREEEKRLAGLREDKGGKKMTREDFMATLVALSKNAGFRLTTDMTLAEYAAYLKDYKQEIEHLKQLRNAKNNQK